MWHSIKFCTSVFSCLVEEENNRNLCAVSPPQSPHHSLLSFTSPAGFFFFYPPPGNCLLSCIPSLQWMKKANLTGQTICHVCQERRVKGLFDCWWCCHQHHDGLRYLETKLPTEPFSVRPTWDLSPERCCDSQQQIYQANNEPNFCTMCF